MMALGFIIPVSATVTYPSRFIALTDKDGDVFLVSIPSPYGAQFCAAALQNELIRSKRTPNH